MRRRHVAVLVAATGSCLAGSVWAETPTVHDYAAAMELSQAEIERAKAGEVISGTAAASHDRELVATMAFIVPGASPDELVERDENGLLEKTDAQTVAFSILPSSPTLESFSALHLREEDLRRYKKTVVGDGLNLSEEERSSLQKLGKGASTKQVEAAVHALLLARLNAYQKRGLKGIAPYQLSKGKVRASAEDLKKASEATKIIEKVSPAAFRLFVEYPFEIPEGTEETYRWSYLDAHGELTLVLTHSLYIPEGETWTVVQRQFYVSNGYNCEQAVAAFVPVAEGTAVFYINRTSTDQVDGFGGSAKRSIGSKLLASQLKELFENVSKASAAQ
jgi:hypothetical protein